MTKDIRKQEYILECLSVDANGLMTIKKTWSSERFLAKYSDNDTWKTMLDYDSENKEKKQANYGFAPVIGKSVIIKITSAGKIVDVNGTDRLAQSIVENDNSATPATKAELVRSFSESFKAVPGVLTDYPIQFIGSGQSWRGRWGHCGGNTCPLYTFTLKKAEKGLAYIEVRDVNSSTPVAEKEGFKTDSDLKKILEINLVMDLQTGLIKSCTGKSEIKETIKSVPCEPANVNEPNTEITQMQAQSTFTIKTEILN